MKIRQSFVTNSSSSSFVVIGIPIEDLNKKYIEDQDYYNQYLTNEFYDIIRSPLNSGGQYSKKVGISIDTFLSEYKDVKIGDLHKIAAEEINKQFGTNLTENDMQYFEEGWEEQ